MPVEDFSVDLEVRSYEIDRQLHVGGPVYAQYADHSRFECVRVAGIDIGEMLSSGIGPVNLETVIRFHNELRAGDSVNVTCAWIWGEGKTYRVEHVLRRQDGELAAEVTHVSGLLDLETRRLVADPAAELRSRAVRPGLLGLG